MRKGKRPINMLFSSKAPKTQQVEHCQHFRINQCNFWLPPVGDATLAPAKNFVYFGSIAKVSVPLRIQFFYMSLIDYLQVYNIVSCQHVLSG